MHILIGLILLFVLLALVFDVEKAKKAFKIGIVVILAGVAALILGALISRH